MQKQLIQKLSQQNLNIKQFIDWNQSYQQEQLTLNLQELKSRLEGELKQSIESHVIRKQKNLQELTRSVEVILDVKRKTAEAFGSQEGHNAQNQFQTQMKTQKIGAISLENLVQLINIKNHVEYCLEKLEPIVNNQSNQDNGDVNEEEY